MPPKGKAKNTPNQHDKRHENGLAPPGKRVTRQRSTGQLDGLPNGKPTSIITPPALPSTGLNSGYRFSQSADSTRPSIANHTTTTTASSSTPSPASSSATVPSAERKYSIADVARLPAASPDGQAARGRTSSDVSVEEMGACGESGKDSLYEHSALLAGDSAAYRRNSVYAAGSVPTFSTILASYPLRDAICILIFLLCLPPSLVVVVQSLFAVLHFVPQNAGLSLSTLTNIKEIFNASNVGYPAVATSLFIDLVFWVLWLPLWKPIQCIILDLSQAAIAISLSGPAASNVGPTYSIATCAIAVCMVHVLRYRAIHLTALDYLRSVIHKIGINFQFEMPFFATSFYSSSAIERGWPFTIVRTILGIHIFAQGIKACVRHTLVKANEKDADLTLPKVDPEQLSAADTTPSRLTLPATDSIQQPHTASSTDGRPPGPSPALRAASFRDSNHKKKRKQANQVRNQQPLWASIARTKVTWLKEMEQREAADDAREAALTDNNTNFTLANTTTTTLPTPPPPPLITAPTLIDRIWIYEVRDTEIHFGVDLSVTSATATSEDHGKADVLPSAIDRLKPFFIRVNGAIWSSTRIHAMPASESASLQTPHHFIGEIFGLAPLSSYHCEVVSIAKRMPLCSARLITRAAPTAEQVSATPPLPQQPTLRPSSPRTTLKQSIQSAESKLNDARNRARKAKKDQRAAHAHVKNEISKFRSALENSSANDEKHERRLFQISQHKKQADEATAELKVQVDGFGETPAAEQAKYNSKKGIYNAGLQAKKAATQELDSTKSTLDKDLNSVKSEISSAEDRSEKLTAKITQRAQEVENMQIKQQADQAAQQKRDTDRGNVYLGRQNKEQEIRYMISSLEHETQTHSRKAQEVWHEISALQHWPSQAQHANYPNGGNNNNNFASPSPPDSMGSNGPPSSSHANGFPSNGTSYAHQSFQPSLLSAAPLSNSSFAPRGRSSSMLSQYSGFTDNGDELSAAEPQLPRQHPNAWTYPTAVAADNNTRKPSDGEVFENVSSSGGSGGGSSLTNGSTNGSNSPRPDAKPFIPTVAMAAMAGKKMDYSSPGTIGSGR